MFHLFQNDFLQTLICALRLGEANFWRRNASGTGQAYSKATKLQTTGIQTNELQLMLENSPHWRQCFGWTAFRLLWICISTRASLGLCRLGSPNLPSWLPLVVHKLQVGLGEICRHCILRSGHLMVCSHTFSLACERMQSQSFSTVDRSRRSKMPRSPWH